MKPSRILLLIIFTWISPDRIGAQLLAPGEYAVTYSIGVMTVDPNSGTASVLITGGNPTGGLVLMPNGDLTFVGAADQLRQYDGITGSFIQLHSYPLARALQFLAIEPTGSILATDFDSEAIFRIPVVAGVISPSATVVALGGFFDQLRGIAVEADGMIVVADAGAKAVIRVHPVSGTQSILSAGGLFSQPYGIAVETSGSILVADSDTQAIIRVDSTNGTQSIVSSGALLEQVRGIDFVSTSVLAVVVESDGLNRVVTVDLQSGVQSLISVDPLLVTYAIHDVAVVPSGFGDSDIDSIADSIDNCPTTSNLLQEDADADGVGDACDNCPATRNFDQADNGGFDTSLADGIGDVCQRGDLNEDGIVDIADDALLRRTLVDLPPGFEPSVPPNP